MTCVLILGGYTSLPAAPVHLQGWREPNKKASGLTLSTHPIRHHSTGAARLSGMPAITRSLPISTGILFGATQGSDTKTLRSLLLLRHLQLDRTIPTIHRSDYTIRSSPRSERCNAPISMLTIMNGGRCLCRMILQSGGLIWAATGRS